MTFDIKDGALQIFDVDHGACALLTMPTPQGNKRILIDCGHAANLGNGSWHPGNHLRSINVDFVDLLICTNYDEDHASGVPSLIENRIGVGCILGNPTVSPSVIEHLKREGGMGPGIRNLATSLAIRQRDGLLQSPPVIPGVNLQWFYNSWPYWDTENNLSLVVHLKIHDTNFLFTGDMERDGFENLLRLPAFSQLMPNLHVLIAAHHGRENGRCPSLFDEHRCNPQLILISDCKKQFQSQETVPYYRSKAKGVAAVRGPDARFVMTTRSDGEIRFGWAGKQCSIY